MLGVAALAVSLYLVVGTASGQTTAPSRPWVAEVVTVYTGDTLLLRCKSPEVLEALREQPPDLCEYLRVVKGKDDEFVVHLAGVSSPLYPELPTGGGLGAGSKGALESVVTMATMIKVAGGWVKDIYGAVIADVQVNGKGSLSEVMVTLGQAIPRYDGVSLASGDLQKRLALAARTAVGGQNGKPQGMWMRAPVGAMAPTEYAARRVVMDTRGNMRTAHVP